MTTTEAAPATGESILTATRGMLPLVRDAAQAIEEGRRLTPEVVQALKRAGVFGMAMPRAWGGPEVDPLTQIEIVEVLAAVDGATGWCAMINSDGGFVTSFLDDAVGRALYGHDLQAATVFVVQPGGAMVPVQGGYLVTGRWAFASGCQHAAVFAVGGVVPDATGMRMASSGVPEIRVCVVPASEVQILDTWDTTGVRGSGSHDIELAGVFVADERSFTLVPPSLRRTEPLYAWPQMFTVNMAGVALGIARGAIDDFAALAPVKVGAFTRRPIADEGWVQATVAKAEARVASARAYVIDTVGALWQALVAGREPDELTRARYWLALTYAHDTCRDAVNDLFHAAGSAGLKRSGPFDRRLRDLHTISQHAVLTPARYEQVGRVLVGRPVGPAIF